MGPTWLDACLRNRVRSTSTGLLLVPTQSPAIRGATGGLVHPSGGEFIDMVICIVDPSDPRVELQKDTIIACQAINVDPSIQDI